jgi:hypothetical protein
MQALRRGAVLHGVGEGAQGEDRPGGADGAFEAAVPDAFHVLGQLGLDVVHQASLVLRRQGIGSYELLSHPKHAELRRDRLLGAAAGAQRHLHAAASDVHHQGPLALEVDAVERREIDEPRLLLARDRLRPEADLAPDPVEEVLAVARLADGGGGDRDDLVDVVRRGETPVLGEGFEAALHRGRGELAPRKREGAEADHLLLAVDHAELARPAHLDDDHVQGVAAEIDGGELHGDGPRRRPEEGHGVSARWVHGARITLPFYRWRARRWAFPCV